MLDLSALPLTESEVMDIYKELYVSEGLRVVADAQLAKALEGVQVWLESYEDPLVKGMGQWLRDRLKQVR